MEVYLPRWANLPAQLCSVAAVIVTLLFCITVPALAQAPVPPFAGVVNDSANLRAGPGTTFERMGSVAAGQTVQIVACSDACDWYKLDTGTWIAGFLVTPATDTVRAASDQAPLDTSRPTTNDVANLRAGPGTDYDRVGSVGTGSNLDLRARNESGDWFQLASGAWIAGFLVDNTPSGLPVASVAAVAQPTTVAIAPAAPPEPVGTPNIVIQSVNYDGGVYRVESDEFAVIANQGSAPANLSGWLLNAGDGGQDFGFPDFVLQPGASCRVYTNEYHPETGGFSFGTGRAIWNNKGDCGYLFDDKGTQIDSYCY